jgi:hypothetical protein
VSIGKKVHLPRKMPTAFIEVLEEGQLEFLKAGAQLELDNMADEAAVFMRALVEDLNGPDDFRV